MSRITNPRIAGVAFLAYIAAGITHMILSTRATAGTDLADKLASIARHANDFRISMLLGIVEVFCALVLGMTLYAITRDEDRDLAMLGMICRVAEGVLGAISVQRALTLLWLATATGAEGPGPAAADALAAYLMRGDGVLSATFFAVGSTLFAWLLLRGRMIPVVLGWIGVLASVLLVVCLPLQLVGFLRGPLTKWMWLPMLFFEVPLALWFLIKGVEAPMQAQAASA